MQWNCPHCGVTLAVTEDQLGSGWSFSKCYKCGGFALVRRAEINVIKVDKAPPGERVILPEGSSDLKLGALNREATQKISQGFKANRPTMREATRDLGRESGSSDAALAAAAFAQGFGPSGNGGAVAQAIDINSIKFSDPLPYTPMKPWYLRMLPFGVLFSATLAVISAVYLVIYGTNIWKKTHEDRFVNVESVAEAPKLKDVLKEAVIAKEISKDLIAKEPVKEAAKEVITDRLQQAAMAPMPANESPVVTAPAPQISVAKLPAITQMAESPQLLVEPTVRVANMHSGPGMAFPVVAKTKINIRYRVKDWNDKWLQIETGPSGGKNEASGWVQNNLVKAYIPTASSGIAK